MWMAAGKARVITRGQDSRYTSKKQISPGDLELLAQLGKQQIHHRHPERKEKFMGTDYHLGGPGRKVTTPRISRRIIKKKTFSNTLVRREDPVSSDALVSFVKQFLQRSPVTPLNKENSFKPLVTLLKRMAKSLNIKLTFKPGLTDKLYGKDNDYKFATQKTIETYRDTTCSNCLVVVSLALHSKHVVSGQLRMCVRRELPNDAEFLLVMQMLLAHSYL
ncbi:hypothetical protein ABVT39_002227 [Epinephelus coioides]